MNQTVSCRTISECPSFEPCLRSQSHPQITITPAEDVARLTLAQDAGSMGAADSNWSIVSTLPQATAVVVKP